MDPVVLLALAAVILVVLVRTFFKQGPKPKRGWKPIATKSRFKTFDNPLKSYRLEPTDNIRRKALSCQAEQIANENPAELAFKGWLKELCVKNRYQEIIYRRGGYIVVDFFIDGHRLVFEIDGTSHKSTIGYDMGRDAWLLRTHSIRTVRVPARTAFSRMASIAIIQANLGTR